VMNSAGGKAQMRQPKCCPYGAIPGETRVAGQVRPQLVVYAVIESKRGY